MVHASGANITYLKATEEPHTNCRNFSLPATKHRRIFPPLYVLRLRLCGKFALDPSDISDSQPECGVLSKRLYNIS